MLDQLSHIQCLDRVFVFLAYLYNISIEVKVQKEKENREYKERQQIKVLLSLHQAWSQNIFLYLNEFLAIKKL